MLDALRLKKIRYKEQKKFNQSNLMIYKEITQYIKNSFLSSNEREEILQQIMDMMLQAQIENKAVKQIIGNDYEVFCDSIIVEYSNDKSDTFKSLNYIEVYFIWASLMIVILVIGSAIIRFKTIFVLPASSLIMVNAMALYTVLFRNAKRRAKYIPIFGNMKFKSYSYTGSNSARILIYFAAWLVPLILLGPIIDYVLDFSQIVSIVVGSLIIIGGIELYKGNYKRNNGIN